MKIQEIFNDIQNDISAWNYYQLPKTKLDIWTRTNKFWHLFHCLLDKSFLCFPNQNISKEQFANIVEKSGIELNVIMNKKHNLSWRDKIIDFDNLPLGCAKWILEFSILLLQINFCKDELYLQELYIIKNLMRKSAENFSR